ncbi:Six-hairpin glycosidase [Clathrospora elynae]|uniref:Six-hairpin glycosidase n=1 Tax=Clathrospora elynae TaxID=706981 RepID=A0A6A5SZQ1_9PLEO|nr:Six-hairpin glycosidase [Clathrospora elynae]
MRFSRVASSWRLHTVLFLLLAEFMTSSIAIGLEQSVYQAENQNILRVLLAVSSLPPTEPAHTPSSDSPPSATPTYTTMEANVLRDLHCALSIMQDHYFAVWLGKWTTAIDWTAAVMGTYVSATLSSLSRSIDYTIPGTCDKNRKLDAEAQMVEEEINRYFAQTVAYYFGEDHFAIRMQAFDDILWVVLGWLEATQFIENHSGSHYAPAGLGQQNGEGAQDWHASQFIPAFAHRARIFYELAEKGWDWNLCGGGMTWNPRLLPYKNAITNQLFISASISMYLHFPGDENCSPFLSQYDKSKPHKNELYDECDENSRGRFDPLYLANAVNGYQWLQSSGMTNELGLYADGFHIAGYRTNHSKTTCDERNEMVYTYNQGVILSGLRGLWEATGKILYLEDGHELIRNVIRATGWTDAKLFPMPAFTTPQRHQKRDSEKYNPANWSGLGSAGILTEVCDPSGRCSQNGQTFKGIFFHHLTAFCERLPARPVRPGKTHAASRETAMLHQKSCDEYTGWVVHNARAALQTRDENGRFGAWWGAPYSSHNSKESIQAPVLPDGAVDSRKSIDYEHIQTRATGDLNDRGRGRTVETQGSGLAVVRAMYEFLRRAEGDLDFDL